MIVLAQKQGGREGVFGTETFTLFIATDCCLSSNVLKKRNTSMIRIHYYTGTVSNILHYNLGIMSRMSQTHVPLKDLLFSLPLQVQPPNVQLKLLHTNSQTMPLMVHKPLANGSPAIVLALLQQATKTILINLAAGPSIHDKRSLDFIGLPGLILRSQRAMRSSRCTWTQEMAAHQS